MIVFRLCEWKHEREISLLSLHQPRQRLRQPAA
jgi:hypothetical protein